MSARLLVELFGRCDDSKLGWEGEFAKSLSEFGMGEPSVLIGFDDGRWQGKEVADGGDISPIPDENSTHYLKLTFRNEDAAFYQYSLFPSMNEPFLAGGARKLDGAFQHVRVDLPHPDDLQLFIEGLRSNPHLIAVEESTEDVFWAAPSHGV